MHNSREVGSSAQKCSWLGYGQHPLSIFPKLKGNISSLAPDFQLQLPKKCGSAPPNPWLPPQHMGTALVVRENIRLSIPSRRILLYSHRENSFLQEAASSAPTPVKLLITVQIQRKQEQGRKEGMRKGEADSRSPAHPNYSLGKLFLPQLLLLGINHLFHCSWTLKFPSPWRPSGAAPSFHTPTAPLSSDPQKAHCPLGTWRSLRKSTWKTTNSPAHVASTFSQAYRTKSQIPTLWKSNPGTYQPAFPPAAAWDKDVGITTGNKQRWSHTSPNH